MNLSHLPKEGGSDWGFIPPVDDVFDLFRECRRKWNPESVLEIGFLYGHSTTYLLELLTEGKVVSVSPGEESSLSFDGARRRQEMYVTMKEKYADRWEWIPESTISSWTALDKHAPFDFALVDGSHEEKNVSIDLMTCKHFNINTVLIDNLEQTQVLSAIPAEDWRIILARPYVSDQNNTLSIIGILERINA